MPTVSFKCSDEELASIKRLAEGSSMSVSQYIRSSVLGASTPSNGTYATLATRVDTLTTAMKLGGLEDAITQAQNALGQKE